MPSAVKSRRTGETCRYSEFPKKEYLARYARAVALMDQAGVEGLLVTQPLNIRYFAGGPLT